jgi:DNA polymerase (family 10)
MQLPVSTNLSNSELADLLDFIAQVLILKKDSIYRIRAYENAANTIRHMDEDIVILVQKGEDLEKLPSIGQTLSKKLIELYTTGEIKSFQKLVQDLPAGMLPLTKIHSIGPKKAFKLATTFKLNDASTALSKLIDHVKKGQVRDLDGFGEKSEQELLEALEREAQKSTRISFDQANLMADEIISELELCPDISKIEKLGSLRRQEISIGDIDLGIVVTDLKKAKLYIEKLKSIKYVLSAGDNLISLQNHQQVQIDIKISPEDEWGSFLQHFTGSKTHNIVLRKYALNLGYSLSEHGIKKIDQPQAEIIKFADEKDFYHFLNLEWIPPQERKGDQELNKFKLQTTNK